MAKIVIIAPADADEDVKDAVKMLKAAGHDVDTEEPTPKSLLHIVLGLLGPNAYGFGPAYGYREADAPAKEDDAETKGDEEETDTSVTSSDTEAGDAEISDDDFNFESLGMATVDGELIEAVTFNSDTSVLCVEGLTKGAKTTYTLNESTFSFWPSNPEAPAQRVEVVVEKHRTSMEIAVQEAEAKSVLKVGKDLRGMFAQKQPSE
jgi:hypothetical protein